MEYFAKYIKKRTVVGAIQANAEMNLGDLGYLATNDYIIRLADGSLKTLDQTTFESLYERAPDNLPLEGTIDWS